MNEHNSLYAALEMTVVKQAAEEMQSLSDDEVDFSAKYRRRMNRLIKDQRKPYYPLIKTTFRRVVFVAIAAMLMTITAFAAVPPLREWFIGLFTSQHEANADVNTAIGEIPTNELPDGFILAEPKFIPEGFKEETRNYDSGIKINFTNSNKKIVYSQNYITSTNQINTDSATSEKVKIGEFDAIMNYDNDSAVIIWTDGKYTYSIIGNLCKTDIIEMANSVIPTK